MRFRKQFVPTLTVVGATHSTEIFAVDLFIAYNQVGTLPSPFVVSPPIRHLRMSGMIALTRLFAAWFVAVLLAASAPDPVRAQNEAGTADGIFETVQNPITDATLTQMKNRIDRAINQPNARIRKVVFDFNPGDNEAGSPNYGSSRDFAEYIQKLKDNGVATIAFVHGKTSRHTVLPALACNDLVMSADAKIGDVITGNDPVSPDVAAMYAKVAGKTNEAVVLKMLDRNMVVVSGRKDGNTVYVDQANAEREGVHIADRAKPPVLSRGATGLYTLEQATQFGLSSATRETREAVAELYNISTASLRGDRTGGKPVKAVKIDLAGPIDDAMFQKLKGQLKEVRRKNENTIFFIVECNGGNAKVAREMADEIRQLKNDEGDPVWTVAFIPNRAADLATFVAFACSEIVMFKGSDTTREATIGEFETFLTAASKTNDPANNVGYIKPNLVEIAKLQGYPPLIAEAMLDKDMTLVQVRDKNKPGDSHELMTGREFDQAKLRKDAQIVLIKTIKQPGTLLTLSATQARELRIAQTLIDNKDPKELYTLNGLTEKDVRDSKPGWLDDLAAFLRRTEIIFLLIAVGFAALILEFKMPGATIPGLISLCCFVLFFWSQAYANGAMIYLAIGLFVIGLVLIAIEVFILPGFGVMGISGILMVLASLGLATMEKAPSTSSEWLLFGENFATFGSSLFVACISALVIAKYLLKIPFANRLMLVPPSDSPDDDPDAVPLPGVEHAAALLGLTGTATSTLRPAGSARIGDYYVDVVTEGDFIEAGTTIQVVEVEGTRIVVKKV